MHDTIMNSPSSIFNKLSWKLSFSQFVMSTGLLYGGNKTSVACYLYKRISVFNSPMGLICLSFPYLQQIFNHLHLMISK